MEIITNIWGSDLQLKKRTSHTGPVHFRNNLVPISQVMKLKLGKISTVLNSTGNKVT